MSKNGTTTLKETFAVPAAKRDATPTPPIESLGEGRDYLTTDEAMKFLGISRELVTKYCREGRFNVGKKQGAFNLGKQWVVYKSVIVEFAKHPRQRGNPNFTQP